MKRLLLLLLFAAAPCFATNAVFVAQTAAGGNTGADCADAKAISYFNTSGNWSATPSGIQIGPGTTVHLCGTITFELAFQGSGGSGNPVDLLFETGANISVSPGCDSQGCVNIGGFSNILIDGGAGQPCGWNVQTNSSEGTCNGKIRNMLYGTTGAACPGGACTTEQASPTGNLIQGCSGSGCSGGSNIEIRNIELGPSYIHIATGAGAGDSGGTQCVEMLDGNNWSIHDIKGHDAVWCLVLAFTGSGTYTNWSITNNELYNNSHMTAWTGSSTAKLDGFTLTGNYSHDMSNWDTTSDCGDGNLGDCNHGNTIHIYGGGVAGASYKNGIIANNYMGGNMGADATAQIFIEAANSDAQNVEVFNNVLYDVGGLVGGERLILFNSCTLGGCNFLNNTLEGASSSNGSCMFIGANGSTNTAMAHVENNAVDDCSVDGESDIVTYTTINFNLYGNTGARFRVNSSDVTFAAWKTGTGEGSSSANISSASLGLNTSTFRPNVGSALIGAGSNLTALCSGLLTGLCTDISGVTRPTSGAWNIGAFEPAGSGTVSNPSCSPTAGTFTGTTGAITCNTVTGGATICYTITGATPTTNSAGSCTGATLTLSGTLTFTSTTTLKLVGTLSGDTDSGVVTLVYTVNYALTVTVVGSGSVTDNTAVISCPSTCSATYSAGTVVTLTATPNVGNTFTGWSGSGGCTGTGTCVLTMSTARAATASFTSSSSIPGTVISQGIGLSNGVSIH